MIKQNFICVLFLSLLTLFSICLSLTKGSSFININQILNAIFGHSEPMIHDILFDLRLPRTLSAFVTGALLALAGSLMQVLLRNPLADPYVLGVSGGAAVMALLSILLGLSGIWMTTSAWLGSLMAIAAVFILSTNNQWGSERILLTGIALATSFSALVSFILVMSPAEELHSMLFWLLGDLSSAHMPIIESVILLVGLIISFFSAKELNILILGEKEANILGVETTQLKIRLYFLAALLTAAAVALAGCIGFIGLIVPHLFRLLFTYDHRWLIPGSAVLGGSLLTIADTFSRTLFAPQQIPVGITMALLGVPVFLFLLRKKSC